MKNRNITYVGTKLQEAVSVVREMMVLPAWAATLRQKIQSTE